MSHPAAAAFCYGLAAGLLADRLLDWAATRLGTYLHDRHARRSA